MDDRLATVLDYEARLKSLTAQSELYQAREAIFLLPVTENPQVRGGRGGGMSVRPAGNRVPPGKGVWKKCGISVRKCAPHPPPRPPD